MNQNQSVVFEMYSMIFVEIVSLIIVVSFCVFIISSIIVYIRRAKLKQQLQRIGFERYDEIFVTGILNTNFSRDMKEMRFFFGSEWGSVQSAEIVLALKKHRRLEILNVVSFVIFPVGYVVLLVQALITSSL